MMRSERPHPGLLEQLLNGNCPLYKVAVTAQGPTLLEVLPDPAGILVNYYVARPDAWWWTGDEQTDPEALMNRWGSANWQVDIPRRPPWPLPPRSGTARRQRPSPQPRLETPVGRRRRAQGN